MKKTIKALFLIMHIISLAMFSSTINASPSLNSQCPYHITAPYNSNGLLFNESCTVAYVFPPQFGDAEIAALTRTTNLQFCPAVKNVARVANKTIFSMETIGLKIEQMIKDFDPLDQELLDLRLNVATKKAKMETAKKRLEGAENQSVVLVQASRDARLNYKKCVENLSEEDISCIELKNAWVQAKEEMINFEKNEYSPSRELAFDSKEDYEIDSARFHVIHNRYVEGINPLIDLQEKVAELGAKVMKLYFEYTQLEGATGQILWSVPWENLISAYRQANSHLNISWEKLPIREYELLTSINTSETTLGLHSVPGLKSAVFPGTKPTGFSGMGDGQKITSPQIQPSPPTEASIKFGSSVSGQIVLTLAGACPYFDGIEERTSINLDDLTGYIIANLVYSFEVSTRRGYTATYNLSNMLRRVEEKSKEGGLFSTDVSHSILDLGDSEDWFSISFSGNSAEFQYTPEEQHEITQSVKRELYDKAFEQFAILNAGSASPPRVPDFLESGASIGSRKLRRCCNKYCQASSALLGIANGIWGDSKATAEFYKNNNSWASEKVDGLQFVSRSGSLSFRRE